MPTLEEARVFCKEHINSNPQWEDVVFVGEIDREQAKSLWDLSRLEDNDWPVFYPEDYVKHDKNDRPFAYVCSPLRGDVEANMERACEYSRQVFEAGYCPITPHVYFPTFLRDDIPQEREAGITMGESMLPLCRALVVCGSEVTEGMSREIRAAERHGIPILTLDVFLPETVTDRPPAAAPDLLAQITEARKISENRQAIEKDITETVAVNAEAQSDLAHGQDETRYSLSVCIDNPEEEHSGWWIGLPASKESVQAVLNEMEIYDGDITANNYTSGISFLAYRLGEITGPVRIDELNYLAVRLQSLEGYGRDIFEAALESGRNCGNVRDIINLTFSENINRFDLLPFFDAQQYGDFLINSFHQNEHADAFNRLEQSDDPDDRSLAAHIERLEAHIDFETYGREMVTKENGVFTDKGYLTGGDGITEMYHGLDDIPPEFRVFAYPETTSYIKAENTDLATLVYKIHAVSGNYATDANYNISKLAGGSDYYLMLMSDRNIFVCETGAAYYRDTTAHDVWKNWFDMSDSLRAFSLHVTGRKGGCVLGSITEIDAAERQRDILDHSFSFMQIDATMKNGAKRTFAPNEWETMEPIDRDKVKSWVARYDMDELDRLVPHLISIHEKQEASVNIITPYKFLSDMSRAYMETAENPQPDMIRVNLSAARELLARSDAPVYRLLPNGAEPLNPIDSIRNGLGFAHYREFAIKREDMIGFNKWAERGADDIIRSAAHRTERDKAPKYHGEEH